MNKKNNIMSKYIDDLLNVDLDYINEISSQLKTREQLLKAEIKALPKGIFRSNKNGDFYKWYIDKNGKRNFLPHSNRPKAQQLIQREYKELLLRDVQEKISFIDQYLHQRDKNFHSFKQLLHKTNDYPILLKEYYRESFDQMLSWMEAPFEPNPYHPERKIHETKSGINVRSKSEVLIADTLYDYGIPFRYEYPLELNGTIVYPDFTFMDSPMRTIKYWEHNGLMDNIQYSSRAVEKQRDYINNGIYPSIHLINTFETKDYPLTHREVNKIIELYFS
ncbi:MAG: hypothetical protein K5675_06590 [Lachnospiraceae bacterium]|nr:hypothetical protein [Lachnospiraceae bacterium]